METSTVNQGACFLPPAPVIHCWSGGSSWRETRKVPISCQICQCWDSSSSIVTFWSDQEVKCRWCIKNIELTHNSECKDPTYSHIQCLFSILGWQRSCIAGADVCWRSHKERPQSWCEQILDATKCRKSLNFMEKTWFSIEFPFPAVAGHIGISLVWPKAHGRSLRCQVMEGTSCWVW